MFMNRESLARCLVGVATPQREQYTLYKLHYFSCSSRSRQGLLGGLFKGVDDRHNFVYIFYISY